MPKENIIVFYSARGFPDAGCALMNKTVSSGFKNAYILEGGLAAWRKEGYAVLSEKRIPRVASPAVKAGQLSGWKKSAKNPLIIDIRSSQAFGANHLDGSMHIPLGELHIRYAEIPMDRSLLIVDEDGRTGLLAASYLARKGFPDVKRLQGGMAAFKRGT
jgi:rhodanese-related sulfurtransferase